MAELTGSEILAKALKKEGTDNLLFIMGGPMLLAEASCIKEGIRMIDDTRSSFETRVISRAMS